MPSSPSTRLALTSPLTSEAAAGPANIATLISQLEAKAVGFLQGVIGARPAAAAGNAGYVYWSTDTKQFYFSTGSAWQKIDFRMPLGTSFPSSPADGDETRVLVTNSVIAGGRLNWHFVYDAGEIADSSKWMFIGGPPAEVFSTLTETPPDVSPFFGSAGPSLSLQYAGVYLVRGFAIMNVPPAGYGNLVLRNGGVINSEQGPMFNADGGGTARTMTLTCEWSVTVAASGVLELGVTGGGTVAQRKMIITPVRVSP